MRVGSLSLLNQYFLIFLADEINRTPPKTQAALLEAMQERYNHAGENHQLDLPYFVLATKTQSSKKERILCLRHS
jgi:MoxR-like ATPase